jgi:hypothetical protein
VDRLYGKYNPEKLGDVDTLVAKYGEVKLLGMVRKKFREQDLGGSLVAMMQRARVALAARVTPHVDPASPTPPAELCCPLTGALMVDAVVTVEGHTYGHAAITAWLSKDGSEPTTVLTFSRGRSSHLYAPLCMSLVILHTNQTGRGGGVHDCTLHDHALLGQHHRVALRWVTFTGRVRRAGRWRTAVWRRTARWRAWPRDGCATTAGRSPRSAGPTLAAWKARLAVGGKVFKDLLAPPFTVDGALPMRYPGGEGGGGGAGK